MRNVNYYFFEAVIREQAIRLLRARNGKEAVEICRREPSLTLVLMDIKMPQMNGFDATRQIKAIRPGLPVIAITALAKEEDQKAAMDAGCDGYLSKPVKNKDLLTYIKKFI